MAAPRSLRPPRRLALSWDRAAIAIGMAIPLAAAAACGGSSSETPWPVEPILSEPPPPGERLPGAPAADAGLAPP